MHSLRHHAKNLEREEHLPPMPGKNAPPLVPEPEANALAPSRQSLRGLDWFIFFLPMCKLGSAHSSRSI